MKTTCHSSENQAMKLELVKAQNVIDRFITSCSHSLRGPLKTIKGLTNVDQHCEIKLILKLIDQTVHKMETILTDLEHFLENSKRELQIEEIDIERLVNDIIEEYRTDLDMKNIKVSIEMEKLNSFYSDKERLRLVLSNLLSNAIHFNDENKSMHFIKLQISIHESSCEISVLDNGIGISSECGDKIFHLFYRASEKSTGAGVGLWIARDAMEKLGGLISVDSKLYLGSKFFIWMPNKFAETNSERLKEIGNH
jgi:signal transduction histidine kinase